MPHVRHYLDHVLQSLQMLEHSLIHKVSVPGTGAIEHHLLALNKFVTLGLDGDVHNNEAIFIGASIKQPDAPHMLLNRLTCRR